MKNRITIKFVPNDIWVGVYWKTTSKWGGSNTLGFKRTYIYLCIVPMFPIIFYIRHSKHDS